MAKPSLAIEVVKISYSEEEFRRAVAVAMQQGLLTTEADRRKIGISRTPGPVSVIAEMELLVKAA